MRARETTRDNNACVVRITGRVRLNATFVGAYRFAVVWNVDDGGAVGVRPGPEHGLHGRDRKRTPGGMEIGSVTNFRRLLRAGGRVRTWW